MTAISPTDLPEGAAAQRVTMLQDIRNRPSQYLSDLASCAPFLFSTGSMAYGIFLGAEAGLPLGATTTIGANLVVTTVTAWGQMRATHEGRLFGTPYRAQGCANWVTSGLLAGTSIVSGGVSGLLKMALPITAYFFWGKGEWDLGTHADRVTGLKRQGWTPEKIDADLETHKLEKKYQRELGTADTIAPFKNQSAAQITETFVTLLTHPFSLSGGQFAALAPLGFFVTAICKTFNKNMRLVKNANNACSLGYAVGAAAAFYNHEPWFGVAMAFFSWGCRKLATSPSRPAPLSADEYAREHRLLPSS